MTDLTHLSLFSGIGGLDLAAEWAGFRTVGQCEWADYPRAVLEKHWPGLPRWRDIRTLTKESFYEQTKIEHPTVVSGGFPCQPHSLAGKRLASNDERDLWSELFRVYCETGARWLVGENVGGYSQVRMDGFSEEFSGTWPKEGVMYGGTVFQPMLPVPHFGVSVSPLWLRPLASDGTAWMRVRRDSPRLTIVDAWQRKRQDRNLYDYMWNGLSVTRAAELNGMMMGFPKDWTVLEPTETPSCPSSFTPSSGE